MCFARVRQAGRQSDTPSASSCPLHLEPGECKTVDSYDDIPTVFSGRAAMDDVERERLLRILRERGMVRPQELREEGFGKDCLLRLYKEGCLTASTEGFTRRVTLT